MSHAVFCLGLSVFGIAFSIAGHCYPALAINAVCGIYWTVQISTKRRS